MENSYRTNGNCQFGYRLKPVKNPEEQFIINLCRKWQDENIGTTEIARRLNAMGFKNRMGRNFLVPGVTRVLQLQEVDSEKYRFRGHAPYGWMFLVEENPEELDTLKEIYAMRSRGRTLKQIAEKLQAENAPLPRYGNAWTAQSVARALKSAPLPRFGRGRA